MEGVMKISDYRKVKDHALRRAIFQAYKACMAKRYPLFVNESEEA
jgi:hypothetical protein